MKRIEPFEHFPEYISRQEPIHYSFISFGKQWEEMRWEEMNWEQKLRSRVRVPHHPRRASSVPACQRVSLQFCVWICAQQRSGAAGKAGSSPDARAFFCLCQKRHPKRPSCNEAAAMGVFVCRSSGICLECGWWTPVFFPHVRLLALRLPRLHWPQQPAVPLSFHIHISSTPHPHHIHRRSPLLPHNRSLRSQLRSSSNSGHLNPCGETARDPAPRAGQPTTQTAQKNSGTRTDTPSGVLGSPARKMSSVAWQLIYTSSRPVHVSSRTSTWNNQIPAKRCRRSAACFCSPWRLHA